MPGPRAALERGRQEAALRLISTAGPGREGARLSIWQQTVVLGGPQTGTGAWVTALVRLSHIIIMDSEKRVMLGLRDE